ncbi:MAG: HIT family protein [Candidatus Cardinium sp.]|uniref:HIT family protein n=1 Tax=Cardinium endosymbiont of Dermatophagoides farinae TaxID=2597823 RepID=UPI001181E376|nr:HIT family protein [Cardinium endosymbiont of Dermatophagoides farinae]TSJ80649.1 HIT family protein [Cardinium endosymbiont of Dermatophagoides farinae]UWW96644.1 MAG: HIT family protein [Candidatus Cardinium sp.]
MQTPTDLSTHSCIFCQIAAGQAPCHTIWEDVHYMAFLSIFPNTEGFTVVIPKHHLSSYIFDHASEEINGLMAAAKQVADLLVDKFPTVERTALVFEGYGVNHLHAKLIPLHGTKGDNWKRIASTIKTKFDRYPGYISSHDAERESDEKLAAIASLLKN